MRRKLAAGNWKMNGTSAALTELTTLAQAIKDTDVETLVCPPFPLIHRAAEATRDTNVTIGAQDCHAASNGAHTGDTSAEMLADAGAEYVIVGHSERRSDHDERNEDIRAKARTVIEANLTAIICVGESLAQREAANTLDIIGGQLSGSIPDMVTGENLVIAYEPVWAIGTGKVPTAEQIAEVHGFDNIVRLGIIHDPVQPNPAPARLHAAMAFLNDIAIALGCIEIDIQQAMPVRTCAGTTGARLDAEQIIEQRRNKLVVQVMPVIVSNIE